MVTASECPGVVNGVCERQCQLHICSALADFYQASNNVSDAWDGVTGWSRTTNTPCSRLLAETTTANTTRGHAAAASYCSWHGITCCDAALMATGRCRAINSVVGLGLAVNNLNVSMQNSVMFGALKVLHDCGMTVLDLEGNNLVGSLTDRWGELVHLNVLNLGERG